MAIIIVEKGKKTDEQRWSGSCRHCGSKAECVREDLRNITTDTREGGEFCWVRCPICKAGNANGYGGLLMYPIKQ